MKFTKIIRFFWTTPFLLMALHLACAGTSVVERVQALVIYACDSNDHYAFPSRGFRDSLYARITDYYETMSYGKHELSFKEATQGDAFFVSKHDAGYYNTHYDKRRHVRGFAMFNEEILRQVRAGCSTD